MLQHTAESAISISFAGLYPRGDGPRAVDLMGRTSQGRHKGSRQVGRCSLPSGPSSRRSGLRRLAFAMKAYYLRARRPALSRRSHKGRQSFGSGGRLPGRISGVGYANCGAGDAHADHRDHRRLGRVCTMVSTAIHPSAEDTRPGAMGDFFSVAVLVGLWSRRIAQSLGGFFAAFGILLLWWHHLPPTNDRIWADDVAQMTSGTSTAIASPCRTCAISSGAATPTTRSAGKPAATIWPG